MGHSKHKPLSADPPDCYHTRTSPTEQAEGDAAIPVHHLERPKTVVVGALPAGECYPPQPENSPWYHDRTEDRPFRLTGGNRAELKASTRMPGIAPDPRKEIAAILARMTDEEIQREIARAYGEIRTLFEPSERMDDLQLRIDVCEAVLRERRQAIRRL